MDEAAVISTFQSRIASIDTTAQIKEVNNVVTITTDDIVYTFDMANDAIHPTLFGTTARGQETLTCAAGASRESFVVKTFVKDLLIKEAKKKWPKALEENFLNDILIALRMSGKENYVDFKGAFSNGYTIYLIMEDAVCINIKFVFYFVTVLSLLMYVLHREMT